MKKRLFKLMLIIGLFIILPAAGIVLSGCDSGTSFALEAPGCTATWNPTHTYVAWSNVDVNGKSEYQGFRIVCR